jgi:hypothetical protein
MTPFALDRQPRNSTVTISAVNGATLLDFPIFSHFVPAILIIGVAGLTGLFAAYIAIFDPTNDRYLRRAVGLAVVLAIVGVVLLFGHYRLIVTDKSLTKEFRVFGFCVSKESAAFLDTKDIVSQMQKKRAVLLVQRDNGTRIFVEDFSSPEERDWIASNLRDVRMEAIEEAHGNKPVNIGVRERST